MYSFEKDFYQTTLTGAVGVCGIVSQIPDIILNGYKPLNGSILSMSTCYFLSSGIRIPLHYKKWKKYHDVMKKDEFTEEKKLYLEYVKDIAEFLKSIGVSADLVGAYLCTLFIDEGVLSEKDVEFASYKEDNYDKFVDMMGARVATGAFCCRHVASLVTDVINEMGGVACDVSVIRSEKNEKKDFFANHLITGLEHDCKSVLFDPSIPMELLPILGSIKFETQKGKIVTSSFNGNLIYKEESSDFDFERINKLNNKKLKSLEPLEVDDNMFGIYLEAFTTYLTHSREIEEFKMEELPKIKKLSKLNKIISPFSDKDELSIIDA